MRPLRLTLITIAVFQFALGALFVAAPGQVRPLLGLEPGEPVWVDWLLVMAGARFLAFGWGMLVAARDPAGKAAWIDAMIAIQAIDWVATIGYLAAGAVRLEQVTTAAFMPVVFVAALVWFHPRRRPARHDSSHRGEAVAP